MSLKEIFFYLDQNEKLELTHFNFEKKILNKNHFLFCRQNMKIMYIFVVIFALIFQLKT